MRRPHRYAAAGWASVLLLGAVAAVHASPPAADVLSDLRGELAAAVAALGGGARVGVLAVSLDTGDTLFADGADTALAPASNLKLLTTAAALHHLGADYRYTTYLLSRGELRDGVLDGDLVLYGTGDPGISDEFQPSRTAVFEAFADSLLARGVRAVDGDVVGDGTLFAGPLVAEGWDPRDLNDWFTAPSGALSFNENVVTLRVAPTSAGQPPRVHTLPPNAELPLSVRARTVDGRASRRVRIERESPRQPITIEGEIPRTGRDVWRQMTVADPARYAASVLKGVLEERGVAVRGAARSLRAPEPSPVTGRRLWAPGVREEAPVRILATHRSPALREYLAVVNKESHNLYADLALKTVGRISGEEGSFVGGAAVVEDFLASAAGVDTSRVHLLDGSGLSSENRVAAADFVRLMAYMAGSELWDEYWASLPEAGNPRELRRMSGSVAAGNLRAKTGTIENVSALSGLVRSANGERIAFSILVNDVRSTSRAKVVENRIGVRLASFERPFEPLPRGSEPERLASTDGSAGGAASDRGAGEAGADASTPAAADGDGGSTAESDVPERAPAGSHTVASGENFTVIARRYDIPLGTLLEANPGVDPDRLQVGQELTIPAGDGG